MGVVGIRVEETKQCVPRLEPKPGIHRFILLRRPTEFIAARPCRWRKDIASTLRFKLSVVGLRRGEGAGESDVDEIGHRSWGEVDRNFLRDRMRDRSVRVNG